MLTIAVIAASLAAASGANKDLKGLPIQISCISENKPICPAIARVLERRGYTLLATSGRRAAVIPRLVMNFEKRTETSFSFSGKLKWSDDGGRSGHSPDMSFSVSDAEISAGMLDKFVESLLAESGFFQSFPHPHKGN